MTDLFQKLRCYALSLRLIPPRPLMANKVFESIDWSGAFVVASNIERHTTAVIMPGLQDAPTWFGHFDSSKLMISSIDQT
jgi:hypothetical protein